MAVAISSQTTISPKLSAKTKRLILMSIVGWRWRWSGSKRGGRVWIAARLMRFLIFGKESVRKEYEDDNWSPWPEHQGPGQPPPSINGFNPPSEDAVAYARGVWNEMGYEGE